MRRMQLRIATAVLTLALTRAMPALAADPIAEFYAGKTVHVLIGYSVGGGYDLYARMLARHMGKHLPGNPQMLPDNMPGAGSLKVVNFLYGAAPKDGTTFGTFGRGVPMEPLLQRSPGARFDATKLTWIGSVTDEVSVCAFHARTGIKTFADLKASKKPIAVGGTGPGSNTDIYATLVKNVLGAPCGSSPAIPAGRS